MKNIITLLCCLGLGAASYAQNTKQLEVTKILDQMGSKAQEAFRQLDPAEQEALKQLDPELIAITTKPHGEVMYRLNREASKQISLKDLRPAYETAATDDKSSVVIQMQTLGKLIKRLYWGIKFNPLAEPKRAFFKGLFTYDEHIKNGQLSNMDRAIQYSFARLKSHLDENKSEDEVSRDIREIYTLLRLNQDVHPYLNMDDRMAREIPVYLLIWTGISSRPQPEQDELKQVFKKTFPNATLL